jgi:tRNA A37 threonylcarbamoyladenosine synthetase subunit TsaC/SUA5/YrdC
VGVRIPDHPVVQALLRELGEPLISTTASHPAEGEDPIQDPDVIDERFPQLAMVLDAGMGDLHCSTVIDLTAAEPRLVRAGDASARLGAWPAALHRHLHLLGQPRCQHLAAK